MKKIGTLILVFLGTFFANAQTEIFNQLLQKHVNNKGWVNYDAFKKDEAKLDTYLTYLNNTKGVEKWSDNKQKAFWINAYNANVIKTVLSHYPTTSITKIKIKGQEVWGFPLAKVAGKIYSLNQIEHEILRKQWSDPRVHVGVNCASFSCPKLPNVAFTEKNIESVLNKHIKGFVNDPVRNKISKDEVQLSQIFNWFKGDFTKKGTLIDFLNKYSNQKISKEAKVSYLEYNWNLNKQ